MRKFKTSLFTTGIVLFILMTSNTFAQSLTGLWEGHVVSVNKTVKIPANAKFNWEGNYKWNFSLPAGTWASYDAKLDISGTYQNLTGNYSADDKVNTKNTGHYAFTGSFNFDKKLMVWQPEQKLGGNNAAANTVIRSLTYSQEGNYEFLKGRWAASDGTTAVMEFRRDYSGIPLKNETGSSDLVTVENDVTYFIKNDAFFLALNDAKDGVVSKKDGDDEPRKWKFEAAPDQFPKSFRIIPVSKDDQCLVSLENDPSAIGLTDKSDNPEGEQYWRFEKKDDGVVLVNVKSGGRAVHIEDESTGQTILRSRNEAQKWNLEKE
ncbi:MAG: hypothetical protein ACKVTZ_11060 [Bacteroidia bacterium]